jgi:metallo-beta-lactamase family protein
MPSGKPTLTFLGATGTVTGSKYLVTTPHARVLVDCGLFQGLKELRLRNWRPLPLDVTSLDAVVLTHAHIDHAGCLPLLVRQGFNGPVYCTPATQALCRIMLPDAGYLQEEDARYANRKGFSKHHPALPLYTVEDAKNCLGRLNPLDMDTTIQLGVGMALRFARAGHLLGAASVDLEIEGKRLVFSGDVGRPNDPLMHAPKSLERADYLVVESTYGNRRHATDDSAEQLAQVVRRTVKRGGIVLIPSFAVGRAQTLLHLLAVARAQGQIPHDVPIYLNSPMAIDTTELFRQFAGEHRLTTEQCRAMREVATNVVTVEDSKRLNERRGPMIVIAGSGMATGGRIVHHLKQWAGDARNTILLSGFQAAGTRGAALAAGAREIKIHGALWPVRADVAQISGLSAHADYEELVGWLEPLRRRRPTRVFVTHGEPAAAAAFTEHLHKVFGWRAEVPTDGATAVLSE